MEIFIQKILIASVLGGLIGIERSISKKPAGFRTMMLICLGAMLFIDTALRFIGVGFPAEVSRVMGNVITGIGFLGAGSIMRVPEKGNMVEGLTTAATIWIVAALGCMIGLGYYAESIYGAGAVIVVLVLFSKVEHRLVSLIESRKHK